MATKPGLIYAKMAAVLGALDAIAKGRENTQQRYKFRGIDDVMNALHKPLAEHGVFYTAAVRDVTRSDFTTKSGTQMVHYTLVVSYTFHAEDGSCVTYEALGEASDSGDKAAGKAQAYALKLALLQVFCIPTEEQKDTEYESPERAPLATLTEAQASPVGTLQDVLGWIAACETTGALRHGYNTWVKPYQEHPDVLAALKARREALETAAAA